jgi:Kef-type K+ transport system membrane component KefB
VTASVVQLEHLLFATLLQLAVMIGAARLLNTLFRRLGQPGVIGEIVAGLALGPSLLGSLFPGVSHALFGGGASQVISIISQIGLILLMFQIGTDFEFGHLKERRYATGMAAIAVASISVPFCLGLLVGWRSAPALAGNIDPVTYSLFMGVGMAITAVPILGRILRQYDLTRTPIGVVAITAAAANDVVGWVLLAAISAYASASLSGTHTLLQLGGIVAFALVLWFVVRPLVDRLLAAAPPTEHGVAPNVMAVVIGLTFLAGMCTFKLGIFAIFGGFAVGILFHHDAAFVRAWRHQVGAFVLVFFLPVFFTYTGLRTNVLGLGAADLPWLALVLAAAILGKTVPVYLAARAARFTHYEACMLGTLMNTRALMELIVLNIGFDLGFLPQKAFTMMVVMAVVTTVMTGPLLKLLMPRAGYALPAHIEA